MKKRAIVLMTVLLAACGAKQEADTPPAAEKQPAREQQEGEFTILCNEQILFVDRKTGHAVIVDNEGQILGEKQLRFESEDDIRYLRCGDKLYLAE